MENLIDINPPTGPSGNLIKDSSTATFQEDVLLASQEVPVIVDFWAPWCGPCKQLTPTLEKVVKGAAGSVRMVKINIDENPQIAQQLRVQSIPAVFAFSNGQPVDGFIGALPESEVKAFIERLGGAPGPSPVDEALEQARSALDAGDLGAAANIYGQVLKHETSNPSALAGLARCYVGRGDLQLAEQTLAMVPPEHANHAEVTSAKAAVSLAEAAGEAGEVDDLRAQVAGEPDNHEARLNLANALISAGEHQAAIDELLEIFRRDREWNDQAARQQLVKLFDVLGPTHEMTVAGRRQLSSLLFA